MNVAITMLKALGTTIIGSFDKPAKKAEENKEQPKTPEAINPYGPRDEYWDVAGLQFPLRAASKEEAKNPFDKLPVPAMIAGKVSSMGMKRGSTLSLNAKNPEDYLHAGVSSVGLPSVALSAGYLFTVSGPFIEIFEATTGKTFTLLDAGQSIPGEVNQSLIPFFKVSPVPDSENKFTYRDNLAEIRGFVPLDEVPMPTVEVSRQSHSPEHMAELVRLNDPGFFMPGSAWQTEYDRSGPQIGDEANTQNAVFFHPLGTPGQPFEYRQLALELGQNMDAIFYAQPGRCRSTPYKATGNGAYVDFQYTNDDYTRAMQEFLIKLRIAESLADNPHAKVYLSGHSWGATETFHMILKYIQKDEQGFYIDLGLDRKVRIGGFFAFSPHLPQVLPENGKLHEFDFLTSDEYMGRMIWWFAQTVPDVFVYPIVQAMAGEGVEVDMEQWGRGWFQKDGKGYNLTSAWYTSQAGAENSCKKAPQYYEVSKPYWDKGQLEGFPIWIIGGTEDGIIRSDNDVRAKAGHEWQDGARYADPNTGKHYFHRLRDALEPIVGKENVELHWIPGASHLLSKPGGTTLKDVAENKPNYARTGANIVRREISEQQSGN